MDGSQIYPPRTLCGLPPELRLEIWNVIFSSITVTIERGLERREETHTKLSTEESEIQISIRESATRAMSEPPAVPSDVLAIRSVCRLFAAEARQIWHSKVTYNFPSTVAFVDVLSQWPKERVCKLRYVDVRDTPLPLYGFDNPSSYTTHAFSDALPMFPGLELDLLNVESIWLEPNGYPVDLGCEGATRYALHSLLLGQGWRRLRYKSGILGLTPSQKLHLDQLADEAKDTRNEPDFAYGYGRIRPQVSLSRTFFADGTEKKDENLEEVEKWYAEHPEDGKIREFPEDVTELQVALWARRGAHATCVEGGSNRTPIISGLLSRMTWSELRQTDEYLVDDGLDDSTAHL